MDEDFYREGDLEKFFGCAKGILRPGQTPREYIEEIRAGVKGETEIGKAIKHIEKEMNKTGIQSNIKKYYEGELNALKWVIGEDVELLIN